jgi:hypothetical protein
LNRQGQLDEEIAVSARRILRSTVRVWMLPGDGLRRSMATFKAAAVSLASMDRPIAYPTTLRDQASRTTAA